MSSGALQAVRPAPRLEAITPDIFEGSRLPCSGGSTRIAGMALRGQRVAGRVVLAVAGEVDGVALTYDKLVTMKRPAPW